LKAEPAANDTATPGATLNLLYGNGAAPTETGLSINSKGNITFAPGQTFPGTGGSGTITGVTTTSPLTGSGTSGSVALGLNVSALETTLNGKYAPLSGANFTGPVQVNPAGGSNAIVGTSSSAAGVMAKSTTGSAVVGQTTAPAAGQAGVFGNYGALSSTYESQSAFGTIGGVWGDSPAVTAEDFGFRAGVIGTSDGGSGGLFLTDSNNSDALYAENDGNSTAVEAVSIGGTGIVAESGAAKGNQGVAIAGYASHTGIAIQGSLGSLSVLGTPYAEGDEPAAIWADTGDAASYDATALLATADHAQGAIIKNNDPNYSTVIAANYDNTRSIAPIFVAINYGGPGGECVINVSGDLNCSGSVSNVAKVDNGARSVKTFSVQSAENWYEDMGHAELQRGVAHVDLDPVFGQTVNTNEEYLVFLTPEGDCKGLFVSAKSPGGFDVHELGGGISSIAFNYRIVAKRAGHESERLTDVTEQMTRPEEHPSVMHEQEMAGNRPSIPSERLRPGFLSGLRTGASAKPVLPVVPSLHHAAKPTGEKDE
jgi:hypothetical protein